MSPVIALGARLRGSRATAAAAVTLSSFIACALAGCSRETFTGLDLDLQVGTRITQVRLVSVTVDGNDVPLPEAARVFPAVEGRDLRSGDVFTLRFADADAGKIVRVSAAGLVGGVQSSEIVTTESRALQSRSVITVLLPLGYGDAGAPGSGGGPGMAGLGGHSTGIGGAGGMGGGSAGASGSGGGTGAGGVAGAGGSGTGGRGTGGTPGMGGEQGAGGRGTGGAGTGGAGMGGAIAVPSGGCNKPPAIPSSMYNNGAHIMITVGGMLREYVLNVPTSYDNTHPYRLIFAFHELNGNDDEMYRNGYYHLLPLSNGSAIFVAPNGQKGGANCTTANQCGWPDSNNTDQILMDTLVGQIEDSFCVDTSRVFMTGWSYGGAMAYKIACQRSLVGATHGYVRAVAVYSGGQQSGACLPQYPVAYYASHGTNDTVLSYDDGVTMAENFAWPNGCTWAIPTRVDSGNHVCTNVAGCPSGYPVEFCSFAGSSTPDPIDSGQTTSWEYQNVWNFLSLF